MRKSAHKCEAIKFSKGITGMRVTVLLREEDAQIFEAYCNQKGFKKSTLINRLIREHIENSGFSLQNDLFDAQQIMGNSDAQK